MLIKIKEVIELTDKTIVIVDNKNVFMDIYIPKVREVEKWLENFDCEITYGPESSYAIAKLNVSMEGALEIKKLNELNVKKAIEKLNKISKHATTIIIYDDFKVIKTVKNQYYYINNEDCTDFYKLKIVATEEVDCTKDDTYYLSKYPCDISGEAFHEPIYYWFNKKK